MQAHLQFAQSRHARLKLQKSLQANARGTHPTSGDTYVQVTYPKEGRTYNMGFSAMLAEAITSAVYRLSATYPADETQMKL